MNNTRRKTLRSILETLTDANIENLLHEAVTDTESVKDEEQDALDSVSEHFPGSEREAMSQEAVDALEEAYAALEEMLEKLDEAKEALERAQE